MTMKKTAYCTVIAFILAIGLCVVAPLATHNAAYADTGLKATGTTLQTQGKKPTKKLVKKSLYWSGTTLCFTWTKPSAKKWYSSANKKTGYQFQYGHTANFSDGKKAVTTVRSNNGISLSNTKADTNYYVRVRLFNKINGKYYFGPWSLTYSAYRASNSGGSSGSSGSNSSGYTPTQKLNLSVSAGNKTMTISYSTASSWITNGGGSDAKVSGYEIWWTNSLLSTGDPNWNDKFVKYVKDRYTTKVTPKSLTNGTTYYVAVRLYNTVKGVTYYGPWSDVKTCVPKASLGFG